MTYYLMKREEGGLLIDATPHADATVQQTVDAPSWLDAKREFGFTLTDAQKAILARRKKAAAGGGNRA